MQDERTHQERLTRKAPPSGIAEILQSKEPDSEGTEVASPAFGYLRGIRERGASLELRFRDGTSIWFSYSSLGMWQYNPSAGLLLNFSGKTEYLVLIQGSNLDKPLKEGSINLTHAGLQRHRVLFVREMSKEEIQEVGDTGPTIDQIQVVEFESKAERKEWISKYAPAFVR